MKKLILFVVFIVSSTIQIAAQSSKTITGVVKDEFNMAVPAAAVKVVNSNNLGTATNFNGEFELKSSSLSGKLEISSIGYKTKTVDFDANTSKINIILKSSSVDLKEVVLFSSRAIDRKTPVAYSTVSREEIEQKLGNQEFVEILKHTPGVFTTRAGGGFGDGEITMRGFNSSNVAVVINGVPVNGVTNGNVYWSNWAGIGNVTASTQTQRGLGASKLAVPSIGGTINIITQSTEAEKGGRFEYGIGNDGYQKYGLKLSTGLMDNGFAVTAYADRTTGNGYVDGTPFEAVSYFASVSKKINEAHKLTFFATGAPQSHGQRFELMPIQNFRESERGIKTNMDWGYKNGQVYSLSKNFFHKPIMSINHYWSINDDSKLSTSVYYSSGTGGVNFEEGSESSKLSSDVNYRLGGAYSPLNIDKVVEENKANGESTAFIQTRANNHLWYGGLSNYNLELNDVFDVTAGVEFRYAEASSTKVMADLLGGEYVFDDSDINNPNRALKVGDKYGFYSQNYITTYGGFGQLEYDEDNISAFVAANISNTVYAREDFFEKLNSAADQKTDNVNFVGFGGKGGFNYRIDNYHNVFFNGGYFERAPFLNAVWPTNNNDQTNVNAENQKIFSLELGYGLRTEKFAANVNIYRTEWNDRTETYTRTLANDETIFANILGVNALHQGIEVDFEYRPLNKFTLTGMFSLGDWTWQDDVTAILTDSDNNVIDQIDILIQNLPVGRSAQTTASLGAKYNVTESTTLFADYGFYDRFYADFDPSDRNSDGVDPWQVPSYSLLDVSLQHKFKIGALDAKLMARMNNVLDTEYITRANDLDGTAAGASVYFGAGRTFSISSVINF